MTDVTAAGLLEIAGPQMYRRNAFRITGLPTDADRRTVRQRQQKIMPALQLGADVNLGHSLPVRLDEVRSAFDRILGDPRRRLVDEIFWLWDTPDAACGCPSKLHRDHDAAVLAHSAALDLEVESGRLAGDDLEEAQRLWSQAAAEWGRLLRCAAFWDHVRHRIAALDDRQLDESVIDTLRDKMPATLVKPLVELAATASGGSRLADQARGWKFIPSRVVDDQLKEAAAPAYEQVRTAVETAGRRLDDGKPEQAALVVHRDAMTGLKRREALVPHDRHRRTATVRNSVAILLNNCATVLLERDGPGADKRARKRLGTARTLASDPQTKEANRQNTSTLDQVLATFQLIKARVSEMVALGRPDVARRMLQDLKRQLGGGAGTAEIDRMLRELDGKSALYPGGSPYADCGTGLGSSGLGTYPGRFGYRKDVPLRYYRSPLEVVFDFLAGLWESFLHPLRIPALLVGAVVAVWYLAGGEEKPEALPTGAVYSEKIADNAEVGRCLATFEGWERDKSKVPMTRCDRRHWGEVLGYVRLRAAPSPYPGQDQTEALTRFECQMLLAEWGLSAKEYMTSSAHPGEEAWNDSGGAFENYATCVVHRTDGELLTRKLLTDPSRTTENPSVPMNLHTARIAENPPIGSCIAEKRSGAEALGDVPIVRCDSRHRAEIVGYPVLYQPGTRWPGDDAVYAASQKACGRAAGELPSGYRVNVNCAGADKSSGLVKRLVGTREGFR